jgi:replicative DNA helicase
MSHRKLHDKEMEDAVLACMVINNSIIPNIQRKIFENDFFDPFNRIVYRAISTLYAKGFVDIVSLNAETGGTNPGFIAGLTDIIPSASNWDYYATKVKTYSVLRRAIEQAEDLLSATAETINEKLDESIRTLSNISDSSSGSSIKSARDLIIPTIEKVETAFKNRGKITGLPTGFECLDDKLDGWQNELYIFGARPSQGKTACACNSMLRMARKGIRVGLVSAEMKDVRIMLRLLSDQTNINSRSLRNGLLSERNIQQVCIGGEELASLPLYIDDSSTNLEAVVSSCRVMRRVLNVQIIFIDHLGMISMNDKLPAWEKESKKSKTIKYLQKELGIPIVALSQVGRQVENKMPTLADLRGTGSYEEDADTVIFLHRERLEAEDDKPIPALINIAKCRDGEIGLCDLLFFPKLTRFTDVEKERQK